MLKVLVLAAQNNVSDARMEHLIRDRLSWLRFLGFDLGDTTLDANAIRIFRERLTAVGVLDTVFADFDRQLKARGYLPVGGQIVDATLLAAPKQRNNETERAAVKAGKAAAEIWPGEPAKALQKDTDARWTLKFAKARPTADGKPQADIAIPSFGFIRKGKVTDGARYDGRMLRDVVTSDNTASDVWADTARPTSGGSDVRAKLAAYIAASLREGRCPSEQRRPMPLSRRSAPAPRPRSRSPTWPSTCSGAASAEVGQQQPPRGPKRPEIGGNYAASRTAGSCPPFTVISVRLMEPPARCLSAPK